jgi:hypothetical protein
MKRKYLVYTFVLISRLVKANHILSFILFTFNIVWGKLEGGGAPVSQPHFEGSVKSPLTLLKMGVWSPPGLPEIQKTIA